MTGSGPRLGVLLLLAVLLQTVVVTITVLHFSTALNSVRSQCGFGTGQIPPPDRDRDRDRDGGGVSWDQPRSSLQSLKHADFRFFCIPTRRRRAFYDEL